MSNHQKTIAVLERVAETCGDGQNGYRDAAEPVTDAKLPHFFNQQSLERAGFAGRAGRRVT